MAQKQTGMTGKSTGHGRMAKKPTTVQAKVPARTLKSEIATSIHQLEDAGVKAKKASDDAKVQAEKKQKETALKAKKAADSKKSGVHKIVADVKNAAHKTVSKMKMK